MEKILHHLNEIQTNFPSKLPLLLGFGLRKLELQIPCKMLYILESTMCEKDEIEAKPTHPEGWFDLIKWCRIFSMRCLAHQKTKGRSFKIAGI